MTSQPTARFEPDDALLVIRGTGARPSSAALEGRRAHVDGRITGGGKTRSGGLTGPVGGVLATRLGAFEISATPGEPLPGATGSGDLAPAEEGASPTVAAAPTGIGAFVQAALFALLGGLASFGIGNATQAAEISVAVNNLTGTGFDSSLITGIVLVVLVGVVVDTISTTNPALNFTCATSLTKVPR